MRVISFSTQNCLVFLLILVSFLGKSQNLVVNGNFDEWTSKPDNYDQLNRAIGWKNPSKGSPDYYTIGGKNGYGVPSNDHGYMMPHTGSAYAGFIGRVFWDDMKMEVREYVQGKLSKPLKAGKQYCVFFYTAISSESESTVRSIGLSFVNNFEKTMSWSGIALKEHIATNKTAKSSWQKACGIYQAKGGENGFLIGYFLASNATYQEMNYYFVDHVSVVEIKGPKICSCNTYEKLLAKEVVVLENIHFQFGKSDLLPSSYSELNSLYELLMENTSYVLTISGHTDDVGAEEKNQHLSQERANAVAAYLMNKGINKRRMITKGLGSSSPIETNKTAAGRKLNRRVEVQLTE